MATRKVKSTNYFSHDSNARNDEKVVRLRMKLGAAGYGVYFMILERLREEANYMSAKDYNMIAFDLRVDAAIVKSVIEDFGLFVFTNNGKYFYSDSFKRRMDTKDTLRRKRSEGGKVGMEKRWKNKAEKEKSKAELPKEQTAAQTATVTIDSPVEQPANNNASRLKRFFSKENKANLEVLLMNFGLKTDDITVLRKTAKEVVAEWGLASKQHQDYTDWSQHLISLMRIKLTERTQPKGMATQENETPPASADYQYGGGFGGKDV